MKTSLAMYAEEALTDIRELWSRTGGAEPSKGFSGDAQGFFGASTRAILSSLPFPCVSAAVQCLETVRLLWADWIAKYPSQCGQLMLQVSWTEATEVALDEVAATKSSEPLVQLLKGIDSRRPDCPSAALLHLQLVFQYG